MDEIKSKNGAFVWTLSILISGSGIETFNNVKLIPPPPHTHTSVRGTSRSQQNKRTRISSHRNTNNLSIKLHVSSTSNREIDVKCYKRFILITTSDSSQHLARTIFMIMAYFPCKITFVFDIIFTCYPFLEFLLHILRQIMNCYKQDNIMQSISSMNLNYCIIYIGTTSI